MYPPCRSRAVLRKMAEAFRYHYDEEVDSVWYGMADPVLNVTLIRHGW